MLWTILTDWLAVLCLLAWGGWLAHWLRLPPAFGPVAGVAFAMAALQLLGSVGLLWPGAVLFAAGAVVLALRLPRRVWQNALCGPGVPAVLAGVAVLQIAYALRAPEFQTWDEFSHWGVYFKTVFYDHRLAQLVPGLDLVHSAYPQGVPALYGLFALLRPAYAERDVFFTVNLPLLAAGGAVLGCAGQGRGARVCAALAAPLLFWLFAADTPYTTAYMDAPVGAMLAAGLALVTLPPPEPADRPRRALAVGLLCAGVATVKEIGTVFALCVLGIWALQCLLAARRGGRRLPLYWAAAGGPLVATAAGWKLFLALTDTGADQFSSMQSSDFFAAWQAARSGADPYFYDIWARFVDRVNVAPILLHYNALLLFYLCTAASVVLAAGLFWRRRAQQAVAPLCMILYWPCYMAVLFYVYICGMSPYEAQGMASFERYAACFFIGWAGLLLGSAWALWQALPWPRAGQALALLQAGVVAAGSLWGWGAGLDRLVAPAAGWRAVQRQNAAALADAWAATAGGPVWVLSADEGAAYQTLWYYQYELYPLPCELEVPAGQAGVDLDYRLGEHDIRYLALFGASEEFAARYGGAFSDGLAAAHGEAPALYRVTAAPDGERQFVLCD